MDEENKEAGMEEKEQPAEVEEEKDEQPVLVEEDEDQLANLDEEEEETGDLEEERNKAAERAVSLAMEALRKNPDDDEVYGMMLQHANYLNNNNHLLKAVEVQQALHALRPSEKRVWLVLVGWEVRAAGEKGQRQLALDIAQTNLDKASKNGDRILHGEMYEVISSVYSRLDWDRDAADAQWKAAELMPEDKETQLLAVLREINALIDERDQEGIVKHATEGIRMCKEWDKDELLFEFYMRRGAALDSMGNSAGALADALAAKALQPESPGVYKLLSNAYSSLDRPREAARAQEKAVELDPTNEQSKKVLIARLLAVAHID